MTENVFKPTTPEPKKKKTEEEVIAFLTDLIDKSIQRQARSAEFLKEVRKQFPEFDL